MHVLQYCEPKWEDWSLTITNSVQCHKGCATFDTPLKDKVVLLGLGLMTLDINPNPNKFTLSLRGVSKVDTPLNDTGHIGNCQRPAFSQNMYFVYSSLQNNLLRKNLRKKLFLIFATEFMSSVHVVHCFLKYPCTSF